MSQPHLNHRGWLALILVVYAIVAVLFALQTPAWQAPDEPAHYNYIHELAVTGRFPILRMGDYDEAYLELLKSHRFPAELPISPVRYEAHQPPLYYLLAAGVFRLTGGALPALRLLSVVLGALLIWLSYEIARLALPGRPDAALAAAAFVAFLPMHVSMAASVNNDGLADLLLAAILLLSIRYVKKSETGALPPPRDLLALGLLLGLALISKVSAYVALPVVFIALILAWLNAFRLTHHASRLTHYASHLTLVFLPALLIALPWYIRNASIYGNLDILARQWHDAVVVGQLRSAELLAQAGWNGLLERMLVWTFDSFWGVFGWMGVWLDSRIYTALAAFSLAVLAGWLILNSECRIQNSEFRGRRSEVGLRHTQPDTPHSAFCIPHSAFCILSLSALLTAGIFVSYNLIFVQPQGRYLFPALPVIGLAVALGWQAVLRPAIARRAAVLLFLAALAAAIWGLGHEGLNTWSLAIFAGAGLALLAWSLLLQRHPGPAGRRLARIAYALPFLALPALDLLALYAFILPQLT